MKKYVLHPGSIMSRTDGDHHFIGAATLAQLYKVPRHECIVDCGKTPLCNLPKGVVHLYPLYLGGYRSPRGEPL